MFQPMAGGNILIPPWFAEDLNYSGHKVLHFHPDYYNFILVVNKQQK
jgi:hypothetical protein